MGLGAIGLIGTVASTGLAIYGQRQQAQAQEQAAAYNNRLAQAEARNVESQTSEDIARQRTANRAGLASLRARMASSGVLTTTGTPLLLAGEAAGRLEVGIADAARRANMQAASLRAKGRMGVWEAEQYASAANLASIGTAVSGATRAFGMFQQGSYQGVNYGFRP